jgi:hypothetical protein
MFDDPTGEVLRIAGKDKEGLKGLMQSMGIGELTFGRDDNPIVDLKDPNAAPTGGWKLETEIYWRMLRSKRVFSFESLDQLKRYVSGRQAIVSATESPSWHLGSKTKVPKGWRGEDVYFNGKASPAIDAWFQKDATDYWTQCETSSMLTILWGLSKSLGAQKFDTTANLDLDKPNDFIVLWKKFLSSQTNMDEDDWVPGDWGNITNNHHGANLGDLYQGENVIYVGGSYSTGAAFKSSESKFWGMLGTNYPKKDRLRTLQSWTTEVEKFTTPEELQKGAKPGAVVEGVRRFPDEGIFR